jgi:hypothetical protein
VAVERIQSVQCSDHLYVCSNVMWGGGGSHNDTSPHRPKDINIKIHKTNLMDVIIANILFTLR